MVLRARSPKAATSSVTDENAQVMLLEDLAAAQLSEWIYGAEPRNTAQETTPPPPHHPVANYSVHQVINDTAKMATVTADLGSHGKA